MIDYNVHSQNNQLKKWSKIQPHFSSQINYSKKMQYVKLFKLTKDTTILPRAVYVCYHGYYGTRNESDVSGLPYRSTKLEVFRCRNVLKNEGDSAKCVHSAKKLDGFVLEHSFCSKCVLRARKFQISLKFLFKLRAKRDEISN